MGFVIFSYRLLWITGSAVQFRDKPTEAGLREKFSATSEQIVSYVERLKPLASKQAYVAETLPSLLLYAQQYDELIDLALSDRLLHEENRIDRRKRIYRLQFTFQAALRLERYSDAIKLAFLAGEEMAGNKRQLEVLKKNVHLIAPLQGE